MHLLVSLWHVITVFVTVCHAADKFNFRRDNPPPKPPALDVISVSEWVSFSTKMEFADAATASALTIPQLRIIAAEAMAELRARPGMDVNSYPRAMAAMCVDKFVYLTMSVRTPRAPLGKYYKRIDPSVEGSVDQVLDQLEKKWGTRHIKSAMCAEYSTFRKYSNERRRMPLAPFAWPPPAQTTFVVVGEDGKYLPPCDPPNSPENSGHNFDNGRPLDGQTNRLKCYDYGCLTFLRHKGYQVITGVDYNRMEKAQPVAANFVQTLTYKIGTQTFAPTCGPAGGGNVGKRGLPACSPGSKSAATKKPGLQRANTLPASADKPAGAPAKPGDATKSKDKKQSGAGAGASAAANAKTKSASPAPQARGNTRRWVVL